MRASQVQIDGTFPIRGRARCANVSFGSNLRRSGDHHERRLTAPVS